MNFGDDQTPGQPPQRPEEDDDTLDFELEEVLDVNETSDASSASAIEGVERLEFLDELEEDQPQPAEDAPADKPALEPTINFSPDDIDAEQDADIAHEDELEFGDLGMVDEDSSPPAEAELEDAEMIDEFAVEEVEDAEDVDETELEDALVGDVPVVGSTDDA